MDRVRRADDHSNELCIGREVTINGQVTRFAVSFPDVQDEAAAVAMAKPLLDEMERELRDRK